MAFPDVVKGTLLTIISDMAEHSDVFSKNPEKDFTRRRKLNFEDLLRIIVSMEAGTIRDEVLKYFEYDEQTVSNSAFFQQRAKLSDTALPFLFHSFNACYPYVLYKNKYQLLGADGSSFTFTRNPKDPDSYFAPDGKTTNGYNQIHVIPLYDLLSKRYTDTIIQPIRKRNEFQALCSLIDAHQATSNSIPIFIADRGFHSLNVFAHAIEHDSYFLVRATDVKMQRLLDFEYPQGQDVFDMEIERILTRTHSRKKWKHPELASQYKYICQNVSFDYIIPGKQDEYRISLRILRFQIPGGGYENIITNLPADHFPAEEIRELYHLRWGIETSFRELKHIIGAMNFHSKKREYIEIEVWARLLLYNFCSIITGRIIVNHKGTKHKYQVNFSVAYKACHYFLRFRGKEHPPNIEGLIGKNILPIRPDRNFARQHRFRVPVSFTYRFQ